MSISQRATGEGISGQPDNGLAFRYFLDLVSAVGEAAPEDFPEIGARAVHKASDAWNFLAGYAVYLDTAPSVEDEQRREELGVDNLTVAYLNVSEAARSMFDDPETRSYFGGRSLPDVLEPWVDAYKALELQVEATARLSGIN